MRFVYRLGIVESEGVLRIDGQEIEEDAGGRFSERLCGTRGERIGNPGIVRVRCGNEGQEPDAPEPEA